MVQQSQRQQHSMSHRYRFKWVANFQMTFEMVFNWHGNQIHVCFHNFLQILWVFSALKRREREKLKLMIWGKQICSWKNAENINGYYSITIGCLLQWWRRELNHSTCFILLNVQFDRHVRNHHYYCGGVSVHAPYACCTYLHMLSGAAKRRTHHQVEWFVANNSIC